MPEEPYEVDHDLRGFFDGPEKGRIGVTNKVPLSFSKSLTAAVKVVLK